LFISGHNDPVHNSFVDSSGCGIVLNNSECACPHTPNGVLVDENVYNVSGFAQGLPTGHPLFLIIVL
jgi:hypothetical protein